MSAENSREKAIEENDERCIMQIVSMHFNFLYQLLRRVEVSDQLSEKRDPVLLESILMYL